ncbi:hypothetical protein J7T55_015645 [Diaporthe amygdali]|uniref:uncharacterized protein n=1 Tax=Phomopsis amygdali TaxID=1214568 RepID=UPI0022FDC6B6|nr:uncharacterized protein J7T55_015645 [Diaporthe amygdali]KAJ0120907.1 hypothetical protein J7T55_015645 [Diaporthe amygdali]
MTLHGKSYVVTGAASGIGRAIVQKLLDLSATVHAIDKADTISDDGNSKGRLHTHNSVDVSSRQAVEQAFEAILSTSAKLDGLVNCAGIVRQHTSTVENDDLFRQVWEVNLGGTWNVSTQFARSFDVKSDAQTLAKELGATISIVNIGSMASVRGLAGIPGYVASKHAVLGLTRAWAQEWGPVGVRVNLIAPGIIKTSMTTNSGASDDLPVFPTALKPFAQPEEIASVAAFLLSSESSYITGQIIEVNGGWS